MADTWLVRTDRDKAYEYSADSLNEVIDAYHHDVVSGELPDHSIERITSETGVTYEPVWITEEAGVVYRRVWTRDGLAGGGVSRP